MKKQIHILLLILLVFVNTCSTEPETKELINTMWKLELFETDGGVIIPPKDQAYNIKFNDDNTLKGISDCNEIFGYYKLKSNNITIDSLITTKIYCGETSMGDKYSEALYKSKSYQIDRNKLSIYYGINSKLLFIGE